MKTIAAILLLSSCCWALGADKAAVSATEAACGPRNVKFEVKTDKSQHPTPGPENGKALVYVVQEGPGYFSTTFGVDGKWVGANQGRSYFFVPIDPGAHRVCVMRNAMIHAVSLHKLNAEAGQTYYFVPHIVGVGGRIFRFVLDEVGPDQGKDLIERAAFSTSHPK